MPYGTEALGVMRIEKGHFAGNELTGQTTAQMLDHATLVLLATFGRRRQYEPRIVYVDRAINLELLQVTASNRWRKMAEPTSLGHKSKARSKPWSLARWRMLLP